MLDRFKGFWQGVALAPFVSHDASWAVGRELLMAAAEGGVLVCAGPRESPLGLVCATVSRDDPLWGDTWATGREVAETRALVVRHDARGRGIGSALLDAVDERLAAAGVADQAFGALAPNAAAIHLCERRGFRPAWLQMTRYEQRVRPS